jgi:hypothetical protein
VEEREIAKPNKQALHPALASLKNRERKNQL